MAPNINEKRSILLPNAEKSHTRFQSHFTQCYKRWWVSPPPPAPPFVSTRNLSKCNKSLKDPVRGAGSVQVQIQSYRNRQRRNLARKVRNTFPRSEALIVLYIVCWYYNIHVFTWTSHNVYLSIVVCT